MCRACKHQQPTYTVSLRHYVNGLFVPHYATNKLSDAKMNAGRALSLNAQYDRAEIHRSDAHASIIVASMGAM